MSDTTQAIAQATAASASPAAARSWRLRVFLCFFCIYVIWGSTYLAIRYAVETIPPLYLAGVRHLSAGTILLAWAFAKGLRPTRQQIRASVVIGFFFFLVGHGSLHWAEQYVGSGLASLAEHGGDRFARRARLERRWSSGRSDFARNHSPNSVLFAAPFNGMRGLRWRGVSRFAGEAHC